MNEAEIIAALKKKFPENEYAFLPQVRNGTGFVRNARTADAMALGLWPSRGLELHGFEVKVSRADWLREIKQPQKAEDIYAYCDRWWLVVADSSIVHDGELPPTWGLMVMGEKRLRAKVAAPALSAKPLDRLMLAAMLRKAQEYCTDNAVLDKEKRAEYQRGHADGCLTVRHVKRELDDLNRTIGAFQQASGVRIREAWHAGDIGKAVKMVQHGALKDGRDRLQHVAESAKRLADEAAKELAMIDSICLADNIPVSHIAREAERHDTALDSGCAADSERA